MPLNEIAGLSFTVNKLPGPVAELWAMLGSGESNHGEDVKEYYFYLGSHPKPHGDYVTNEELYDPRSSEHVDAPRPIVSGLVVRRVWRV